MKRLILVVVTLAAVATLFTVVDFPTLVTAIAGMPRHSLLAMAALLVVGATLKSLRWAYYLRAAGLNIRWRDGMTTYVAGMSVSALPGGAWLAPRLAQEHGDIRLHQAAPAMFVNSVADTIALSLLAVFAVELNDQSHYRVVVPLAGLATAGLLIAMGRSRAIWGGIDRLLARTRLTRRWLPQEADVHTRVSRLMRPSVIVRGAAFSLVITLLSTAMLVVVVNGLTLFDITPSDGLFVRSTAEATTNLIPVPSGLGVSDSSLATGLNSLGIGFVRATFLALTMRSIDLVFRSVVGSVMLVARYHGFLGQVLHVRSRARRAGRRVASYASLVSRAWTTLTVWRA